MEREEHDGVVAERAPNWSARLGELAARGKVLADEMADLPVSDAVRDPAALGSGAQLAVLGRDLSLVLAGYISSLHSPAGTDDPGSEAQGLNDSVTELGACADDEVAHRTDPLLRDTAEAAELLVRAHELHLLTVRRALG